MNISKKRLAFIVLASALLGMAGTSCRTFQGLGRDVEHAGSHIERAAR
jgi:predicted small secreted protein